MTVLLRWSATMPLVCLLLVGCGGEIRPPGAKPTVAATVTVTYKGAPVDGATITFVGDPAAYGRTDASGKAKMKTYIEGDGAVAGTYQVTVVKVEAVVDNSPDVSSKDYVPPDASAPSPEAKSLIPVKYSLKGTTDLTADVKQGGPNDFKFDLVD